MEGHDEIGRELTAPELTPRTVYVLSKEGRPAITLLFMARTGTLAHFYGGSINMNLLLLIQPDGTFQDDSGMKVTVSEYLGEV